MIYYSTDRLFRYETACTCMSFAFVNPGVAVKSSQEQNVICALIYQLIDGSANIDYQWKIMCA